MWPFLPLSVWPFGTHTGIDLVKDSFYKGCCSLILPSLESGIWLTSDNLGHLLQTLIIPWAEHSHSGTVWDFLSCLWCRTTTWLPGWMLVGPGASTSEQTKPLQVLLRALCPSLCWSQSSLLVCSFMASFMIRPGPAAPLGQLSKQFCWFSEITFVWISVSVLFLQSQTSRKWGMWLTGCYQIN